MRRGTRKDGTAMMFNKANDDGYEEPLEGIRLKALAWGDRAMLCEFRLDRGKTVPAHRHPNEQVGYLVAGRLLFTIGGEELEAAPGDAWAIPPDVEHEAKVLENAVVVETFAPIREDYLPEA